MTCGDAVNGGDDGPTIAEPCGPMPHAPRISAATSPNALDKTHTLSAPLVRTTSLPPLRH
jgi:hypothetical protein